MMNKVTTIKKQISKVPSDSYFWAAILSIGISAALQVMSTRRRLTDQNKLRERSLFVGQWAPTFLVLGLYNRLMKRWGAGRGFLRVA